MRCLWVLPHLRRHVLEGQVHSHVGVARVFRHGRHRRGRLHGRPQNRRRRRSRVVLPRALGGARAVSGSAVRLLSNWSFHLFKSSRRLLTSWATALLRSRKSVALRMSGVTAVAEGPLRRQRLALSRLLPLQLPLPLRHQPPLLLHLQLLHTLRQRCLQLGLHPPPLGSLRRAVADVHAHVAPRASACVTCAGLSGSAALQKREQQLREMPVRALARRMRVELREQECLFP